MQILNVLTPVFLMIALGAVLQRTGFVSPGFLREANRVTYWLGLPALLLSQLVQSFHDARSAGPMLGAMLVATVLLLPAGYLAAWALRVPGAAMGTFVQGGLRGNLAFVGLPIIYLLPDAPLAGGVSVRTAAIVTVAPTMVLYNVVAPAVLLASQHTLSWRMAWPFLRQLAVTPPLLATITGIGLALAGWKLPVALDQTFAALGEMALPLGLLGVGGALVSAKFSGAWRAPLGSALVKTAAGPLLGGLAARTFGLGALETKIVMILMACPTAVVSYTMAVELKGDEAMASGTIVLSVVTSLLALALILAVM